MEVRVPRLGEGADSGTVVTVFVKEGDTVKKDQTVLELENEKAVAAIPSTESGVVSKIHVKPGDKVSVGQLLISLSGGAVAKTAEAPKASASAAPKEALSHAAPAAPSMPAGEYHYESKSGFPPPASPSIRKMAKDLGIDLARVRGSESGGRIGLNDLRNYVQQLQQLAFQSGRPAMAPASSSQPPAESVDFSKWGPVHKKPLTGLRKAIRQQMVRSWTAIPHVTQFDDADITLLSELRKKYSGDYLKKSAKLTLTPLVLKAVVAALKKYPIFNASLDEAAEEIVYKDYYHVGMAVATEQGLIVPVIRDVDKKDILKLALELGELAEKTRQRKVAIDELKGGGFTISNQGNFGGTHFTPIVNRPEVAILGLGRGSLKPVVIADKKVEPRMILPVSLSYDHRVIDGADAVQFLTEIVRQLENFDEKELVLKK